MCKLCHWHTACLDELTAANDLTLLPELGRKKRDALVTRVKTIKDLAQIDLNACKIGKKTIFDGIGLETLEKFKKRAELATSPDPKPYFKKLVELPHRSVEIFFDIEVDPIRDICYLHGFIERHGGDNTTEQYIACFAEDPTFSAEENAFMQAWEYLKKQPDAAVYYYSKYERTIWRKLQQRFPHICNTDEIETLFKNAVDLYGDVVRMYSEWPTLDYSIKTLATYLGFSWRDKHPSGAASIEWFDKWVQTKDVSLKQRILEYNEDDCRATRVLLDGLRALPVFN